jgi:GMP reductase
MKIIEGTKLDFQDVLLIPKHSTVSSRKEVVLERTFKFKYSPETWTGIPIISANMTSVTNDRVSYVLAEHRMLACFPKTIGPLGIRLGNIIPSYGLGQDVLDNSQVFICLDVANGYTEKFVDYVKTVRASHPNLIIIAGNVVTPDMTQTLILAGADVVKVGIGSGSACKTRLVAGVGFPQLSAIDECADAAHGLGGHIISDGGCVNPGDVVKALAAGADFVFLGGMLAGHDENGTDFYGSSSERANNEIAGGLKDYRAAEGWELKIPNRGPLDKTLQDIEGGLRSACAYVGARKLKDLPKCSTFIRVGRQVNDSLIGYRK